MKNYIHYFGYGSLINLNTVQTPYKKFYRARLHGWRRVWQAGENHALLSVEKSPKNHGEKIEGLIICDEAASISKLNQREIDYKKQNIKANEIEWLDKPTNQQHPQWSHHPQCFLYITNYKKQSGAKILRSYLDAILQGVLHHFGEVGVHNFFQSTKNFMPILEDRENPIYPRAIRLSAAQRATIDSIAKNYNE